MRQPQGMIKCPSAQAPVRTGGQTACCWSQGLGGGGGGVGGCPGELLPGLLAPSLCPHAGLRLASLITLRVGRSAQGIRAGWAETRRPRSRALALPGLRTVPATGHTSRNLCAVSVEFSSFRPRSQGVILTPRAGHVGLPLFDKAAEDVSVWRHKGARNPLWTHCTLSPGTQSALRGRGFRILRFN